MAQNTNNANGHGDELASFMAASSVHGSLDLDDEEDEDKHSHVAYSEDRDEAMSTTSSNSEEGCEPFVPPSPDIPLTKMTTLLDCELRADVQSVFELLWSNDQGQKFQRDHMEKTKDIDIEIEDWQEITPQNEADAGKGFVISKEDDYTMFRSVRSQHPPKTKFPGLPPYATCWRTQRFRVEKSSDGSKWNRLVVSELLRMAKIPFSDYFEIESRWVFTRDGKNYCHVQVGLIVNFHKSTWFKSQIDSSTRSETKEGMELWATNAVAFIQENASTTRSLPSSPSASLGGERQAQNEPPVHRLSESSTRSTLEPVRAPREDAPSTKSDISVDSSSLSTFSLTLSRQHASVLQLVTLALLVYCFTVIHSQQARLQQLSETTSMLMAELHEQRSAPPLSAHEALSRTRQMCEQSVVDAAVGALQEFFETQRHQ